VIGVRALPNARVAVIFSGSEEARGRIEKTFTPAIQGRVEELGASIVSTEYVQHEENAIAAAIERARGQTVDCVIIAGETSIMDASDVTPGGIQRAGGVIEAYGAPVEPGNLLLLAYADHLPIIGAPGCVKSRDTNVVDLILPRLLAGERVGKKDIVALANGGLLI
jgi:molybdopterin biosynthesis enzyme